MRIKVFTKKFRGVTKHVGYLDVAETIATGPLVLQGKRKKINVEVIKAADNTLAVEATWQSRQALKFGNLLQPLDAAQSV